MKETCSIPLPIHFNCWKHHLGFIKSQIGSSTTIKEFDTLRKQLVKIGSSQMDLYFGKFSHSEIFQKILEHLHRNKIYSIEKFQSWLLTDGKEYRQIKLKDKSTWVIRLGNGSDRYVHIHPGRYSPKTVRVKATTLKTAILVLSFEKLGKLEKINTESANQIRKKYLNEPPLKSFSSAFGLGRMMQLLIK